MSILIKIARRVRHLPVIERCESLWSWLRRPYRWLLEAGGRGVDVKIGGVVSVRMPAEFAGGDWDSYEPESVAALVDWITDNPDALVLDVGSSIGIFSAVTLFASPTAQVISFDSDLPSLAGVQRMCCHAAGDRLRLVHGLVTDHSSTCISLPEADHMTRLAVGQNEALGSGDTRYICLLDAEVDRISKHCLDSILSSTDWSHRKLLIKCDIEGAELLALKGAAKLLSVVHPALLISVHPSALPDYGHSSTDVETFLNDLGYQIKLLAIDHEEHWWCSHIGNHQLDPIRVRQ